MKRAICVDFDGVIAGYSAWKDGLSIGDLIPGAREFLEELSKDYEIIIYTARVTDERTGGINVERYKKLVWWLQGHGIRYTRIEPKPIAVAYIDDHAIICEPQERGTSDFRRAIEIVNEFDQKYVDKSDIVNKNS